MKKVSIIGLIVLGLVTSAQAVKCGFGALLAGDECLSVEDAKTRWSPARKFDVATFRSGSETVRASMAYDILAKKAYVGQRVAAVRKELGDWDGYFQSDPIPAYVIDEKRTRPNESWLLLFVPDANGVIQNVRIYKSCCAE